MVILGTAMNAESIPDPADEHPARLAVGIVGAGRAGTALGAALAGPATRSWPSPPCPTPRCAGPAELPGRGHRRAQRGHPPGGLALLTVPDDALPGLMAGLVATGAPLEGPLLAHASGRYG